MSSFHPSTPDHSPLRLSWNHSNSLLGCFQGLREVYSWNIKENVGETVVTSTPYPILCALWLEKEGCDHFYVTASSDFALCLYGNNKCYACLKEESHIEDIQVIPPPHRITVQRSQKWPLERCRQW